jgi:hypothetical protein
MILDDLIDFLGSFKNAESLSPELQEIISVPTGLEDTLLAAIKSNGVVILTGSAGSGKTHVLRGFAGKVSSEMLVVDLQDGETRKPHIVIIPDATELSPEERVDLLKKKSKNRKGLVVAINEGPLRAAAKLDASGIYSAAVQMLHAGKRGISLDYDHKKPTIVDMGAYSPLEQGVIADILALPTLHEVVKNSQCTCNPLDCPRRRAWEQLSSPLVRQRVAEIVKLASISESEWLFRDLWDFIADLVLGGSCVGDPPSSPWFWRLFYGQSRLAKSLLEVADPLRVAMPRVEGRIYYGDWDSTHLRLVDDLMMLPLSRPDLSIDRFAWIKAQVILMGCTVPSISRLLTAHLDNLTEAVLNGRVNVVVKAINKYMLFGLREGAETKLELWIDHGVERRTERFHGLLRSGEIDVDALEIRRSQVIINHPVRSAEIPGNRRFLVQSRSAASLSLEPEKLRLLQAVRPIRVSDRPHADLDWDLQTFFESILTTQSANEGLAVVLCDFERLRATTINYRITINPPVIEVAD